MKRRKVNYIKGLWGSWDGQAQGYSESYEGEQAFEAKNDTKLHYLNQYKYIPARNESGAAKIQVFSTRRLKNTSL